MGPSKDLGLPSPAAQLPATQRWLMGVQDPQLLILICHFAKQSNFTEAGDQQKVLFPVLKPCVTWKGAEDFSPGPQSPSLSVPAGSWHRRARPSTRAFSAHPAWWYPVSNLLKSVLETVPALGQTALWGQWWLCLLPGVATVMYPCRDRGHLGGDSGSSGPGLGGCRGRSQPGEAQDPC